MVKVELLGYKIRKINMVNDIPETDSLQLTNHVDFEIDYDNESQAEAAAALYSYTEYRENPGMFFLGVELQAIFRIDGIKKIDEREEVNLRCYDKLFSYMEEIMAYLIANTGIEGFRLQKPALIPKCTNSEVDKSADESSSDRIIIFRTDM